ncbi:MAG: imidazole glycerol phosphate synthase subunit HisH [Candidatus Fermentithermobacillus carboniphilus]|uniref:Imidazole glycerol phosphate synthase subunit HisH n=1 Tax=Candidatus Fermentithermobacillus carboniphilus TaxID=3085328 RepID=A0AAT9L9A7_9FIRM|nr:MAG: imidazole glycerol phosphate synthase subunit HisH [Candidatus Fermentithermobacillus carboniphilus]
MITIVDYGMGNLYSVRKAFERLGIPARVTSDPDLVRCAERLVLPGVGAFGDAVAILESRGLLGAIREFCQAGRPFLGICLGMQLLLTAGEEGGLYPGLGVFRGKTRRLRAGNLKVPHVGWNRVDAAKKIPIFKNVPDKSFFYFVHSYVVELDDSDVIAATTEYGESFPSVIWEKNIFGVQFHPEKSGEAGLLLLGNFAEFVP